MRARPVRNPDRWVMVAVAKDGQTAEDWQQLLGDVNIEAHVRIDDPAIAGIPTPRWAVGNYEPGTGPYSYPLYVRARVASHAGSSPRRAASGAWWWTVPQSSVGSPSSESPCSPSSLWC